MDLMCIANTDGTFKKVSPSFTKILGHEEKDLLSRPFIEFIHPDDLASTAKIVATLSQGVPLIDFENRYRTKSGDYRLISWACEPDPKTGLLYATGRDVTALRNTEYRNQQILDAINQTAIMAFTDYQGRITEVNENFCKISGYSREEALGQNHRILTSGRHPKAFFKEMWTSIKAGKTWTADIENKKKTGEHYFVRSVISPLKNIEGQIEQFMAVRFDITEQKKTEFKLLEAQAIAKIGSWTYDLHTGHQSWSSEHYKIFEIDEPQEQEQLFKLYRERIHPDDLPTLDRFIERATKYGESFAFSHRAFLENGKRIKFVQGIGKVTKNTEGKPILISGTCQDLTELVRIQEENRFILDALQIGVWKFDPINRSLFWDQSMYHLYDLKEEDFPGHYEAWENTLAPESKANAIEELEQALRGEKEFNTVFEIKTKNKGRKFISARGRLVRDRLGQPTMMYGVNTDITKQRESELEREKLANFLELVLKNVPSMIFVKDYKNGLKFSMLNQAGERLLGINRDQVIGKSDYDLFPREQADSFVYKDREIFRGKKILKIDEEIETSAGKRFLQTYKVPTFTAEGEPDLLIGISTDITDELASQRALELERSKSLHHAKLASLGEMSAGIAHEINNPLAIIAASLSLLRKFKDVPEKFDSKLEAVTKAAARIEKIVKGLKKFSRSSEGNIHQNENLAAIINEVMTLVESRSSRHSVPITTEAASDLTIDCDAVEIEQVLINLINNAIDAVKDQEQRWVKIHCFESESGPTVRVIDSGEGISQAVEAKLFQPFFTTKPVGEGTGLGLSIAKGILDQHKATLTVNGEFKNTCFEIRFPRATR